MKLAVIIVAAVSATVRADAPCFTDDDKLVLPSTSLPLSCDAAQCVHAGPHLAAALAKAPGEATLDHATVAVGDELWSVTNDQVIALTRPAIRPNGPARSLEVMGDVVLVHWGGACTDMLCLTAQIVDRRGVEIDTIYSDRGLVRVNDRDVLAFASFTGTTLLDLRTGKVRGKLEDHGAQGTGFIAAARTSDTTVAVLREIDLKRRLDTLSVANGKVRVVSTQAIAQCRK